MKVAAPVLIESGLGLIAGFAGVLMASRMGDSTAAAFGVSNHLWGLLWVTFRMVSAGVSVSVAHALGANERAGADAVARACLGAATWLGGAIGAVALFGGGSMLQLMAVPASVAAQAQSLLQFFALVFVLEAWASALSGVLRAHLHVQDVMRSIVLMNVLHIVCTLLLMPRLGLIGFGVSMLLSRALVVTLYLRLWDRKLNLRPTLRASMRWDHARLVGVMRIGVPTFVENVAWTLAFMFTVRVAAQLGEAALATHTYVMQVVHVIILFAISIGIAIEILAGRMIGAGHFRAAYKFVRRSLWRGVLVTILIALIVALAGKPIMHLFTRDPEIIRLGMMLMWIGVLVEPGRTVNIVMNDALRAAGDAKFPAQVCAPSMLIVLAMGAWWLGIGLGFGLVGVWLAYAADEWIRGLINYGRWHFGGWIPAAQRSVRIAKTETPST